MTYEKNDGLLVGIFARKVETHGAVQGAEHLKSNVINVFV